MMRRAWISIAWGIVLVLTQAAAAEIYIWTDDQRVVNMTDLWTSVPEAMRSRVNVREGSLASISDHPSAVLPVPPTRVPQPPTSARKPLPLPPDVSEPPATSATPPVYVTWDVPVPHVFSPPSHPVIPHPKPSSPPFPYNVQLDPFDPHFVWVGKARVPREALTFPHTSFENQWKFEDRLRVLEQQRSSSPKPPERRWPRP
ncbi:MAG: hypothetical protein HYZ81_25805 [Nitrospinae bacterium]|nr:hypothetical protein [Nitrospinota bacterium]